MIEKIETIAREAGKILMSFHKKKLEIDIKDSNKYDKVTKADREVDKFLRECIAKEFPDDLILSEEEGFTPNDYTGRVWIIDPLDGTDTFLRGEDGFCMIIGLCVNGTPNFGLIYDPVLDNLFYAMKGEGAYHKKDNKLSKMHVSCVNTIEQARAIIKGSDEGNMEYDKMLKSIPIKENLKNASSGLNITKVAKGEADFYINADFRASKWDACAGQIILTEAGGMITGLNNSNLNYKSKKSKLPYSYFASNKILHPKLYNDYLKDFFPPQ